MKKKDKKDLAKASPILPVCDLLGGWWVKTWPFGRVVGDQPNVLGLKKVTAAESPGWEFSFQIYGKNSPTSLPLAFQQTYRALAPTENNSKVFAASCTPPENWTNGYIPKFNMEPENHLLENFQHLPNLHFWVQIVRFWGVPGICSSNWIMSPNIRGEAILFFEFLTPAPQGRFFPTIVISMELNRFHWWNFTLLIPGTPNNQFFMVVSTGWFQITT